MRWKQPNNGWPKPKMTSSMNILNADNNLRAEEARGAVNKVLKWLEKSLPEIF